MPLFDNKQLHEVTYSDLKNFLREEREEGVRLDYKESWTDKIIETACAFANTYGGYIFYGVKEVEQKNKPSKPDSGDIPGIDFSQGGPASSVRSKILDNIRPAIELEIKTVPLEGSTSKGVLIIRIKESMDAPHEVLLSGRKGIPVRRADTKDAASLDEIERLIQRRDSLRDEKYDNPGVEFFGARFLGPRDSLGNRPSLPTLGMTFRPRRSNTLTFSFDSSLDQQIRNTALQNRLGHDLRPRPIPTGLVMEDFEEDDPVLRLEVNKNGMIRAAKPLNSDTADPTVSGETTKKY